MLIVQFVLLQIALEGVQVGFKTRVNDTFKNFRDKVKIRNWAIT